MPAPLYISLPSLIVSLEATALLESRSRSNWLRAVSQWNSLAKASEAFGVIFAKQTESLSISIQTSNEQTQSRAAHKHDNQAPIINALVFDAVFVV